MNKREIKKYAKEWGITGNWYFTPNTCGGRRGQVWINIIGHFDAENLVKFRRMALMGDRNFVITSDFDKGRVHLLSHGGAMFGGRTETEYHGSTEINEPMCMARTLANWK